MGLPGSRDSKESAWKSGDLCLIPGSGKSPEEGKGYQYSGGVGRPLQYSCLENPKDRETWWAIVHGVSKNWTGWKPTAKYMITKVKIPPWVTPLEKILTNTSYTSIQSQTRLKKYRLWYTPHANNVIIKKLQRITTPCPILPQGRWSELGRRN